MVLAPWVPWVPWLLSSLRLGLWLLMLAASAQFLRMAVFGWRSRPLGAAPVGEGALPEPPPLVTVQLPLRNERFVAERAIWSACALDWPRDRLEIQVLDDSDDDTRDIVDRAAAAARAAGHDVTVVRRPDRRGFKAGNLQYALGSARGAFIAVLDADCVAPRDFLRRLLPPLLRDGRVAFAQGRWDFDNERRSLLTRLQALILHGLMLVEQDRLSRLDLPLQFNGTGGVWRRAALEAAGGWIPDGAASVTEDMDLSFRARLRGYRGVQVPEVAVETELPATMAAFRAQQSRWVRGGAQVLRAVIERSGRGLEGQAERPAQRGMLAMLGHLVRHGRQPYLALYCLTAPLLGVPALAPPPAPAASVGMCALLLIAITLYYGAALRRIGRSALGAVALAPALVALSLGLSLCLSRALLCGLLEDRAAAEFVRTPKAGQAGQAAAPAGAYRAELDRGALLDVAVGLLNVLGGAALLAGGRPLAALGVGGLVGGGLLWVGLASLVDR